MEGLIGPQTGGAGGDKVIIDSSSKTNIENTLISKKIDASNPDRITFNAYGNTSGLF